MDEEALQDRLIAAFDCRQVDARAIARKAATLEADVATNPEHWEGPPIDAAYIVSRLDMAPEHLAPTAKWDWWAGMMKSFDGVRQDYRIG